jgi:aspartyl protease family protein
MTTPPSDASNTRAISGWLVVGMWVSLFLLLVMAFNAYWQDDAHPNRNPQAMIGPSGYTLVLQQNRQGHYLLDGFINQQPVTFLLDTGATSVSIPAHLASRLGLSSGRPFPVLTANGAVTVYETVANSLSFGDIEFSQVSAHLNPGMRSDKILLGMSVLKDLQFTQTNQQLTITIPR